MLGTWCEFRFAEWDSLKHRLNYTRMPRVDVGMSIGVTCHLADPLHHLAYLCDHSRRAVFVLVPVNKNSDLSITFGEPGRYAESLAWPLSFDFDVRLSVPLLRMSLAQAGFEDIRELPCPNWLPLPWQNWFRNQKGFLAFRTAKTRTALTLGGGKRRRNLPPGVSAKPHSRGYPPPGPTGCLWVQHHQRWHSLLRRSRLVRGV